MALSLDFLLDEKKPVGTVTLAGKKYELMPMDVVEDMMRLAAVCERAKTTFESATAQMDGDSADADAAGDLDRMTSALDSIATELRGMIRVLVPGLSDQVLRDKFPRVGQLQQAFTALVLEVQRSAPESLKKNSAGITTKTHG